ncbi:Electron-transferring-flavoprotein dehydrogenase protein [Dioscorea alata]|uniref:Electron-transferring-flavoprotein dehydrogenase protein n=1 Tax=Dioscorea alata TaxID=55571 RepID=A0ACB7WQ40_DIOAL|nr:Electron-transferring-flavoprotein dehydrogenase protein [Dioscorea alata]
MPCLLQSIPFPVSPEGAIIGCSTGFLNVPKIKGTHTAMKSGMLAEATFRKLAEGVPMESYWDSLKNYWAFKFGLLPRLAISALEKYIFRGRLPLTLKHGKLDHEE